MVGASRERVNKAISLFVRLEWLELEGRNHYRILDRQALEDRAEPLVASGASERSMSRPRATRPSASAVSSASVSRRRARSASPGPLRREQRPGEVDAVLGVSELADPTRPRRRARARAAARPRRRRCLRRTRTWP